MGYWSKCDHYFVFEHQASGLVLGGEIKSAATLNLMYHGLAFCLLEGLMRGFPSAAGEDTDYVGDCETW